MYHQWRWRKDCYFQLSYLHTCYCSRVSSTHIQVSCLKSCTLHQFSFRNIYSFQEMYIIDSSEKCLNVFVSRINGVNLLIYNCILLSGIYTFFYSIISRNKYNEGCSFKEVIHCCTIQDVIVFSRYVLNLSVFLNAWTTDCNVITKLLLWIWSLSNCIYKWEEE